jgi:hypothetical protein
VADDDYVTDPNEQLATNYTVQPRAYGYDPANDHPNRDPPLVKFPEWAMGAMAQPGSYDQSPAFPAVQAPQPSMGEVLSVEASPFGRPPGTDYPQTPIERGLATVGNYLTSGPDTDALSRRTIEVARKSARGEPLTDDDQQVMNWAGSLGSGFVGSVKPVRMGALADFRSPLPEPPVTAPADAPTLFDYSRVHEVPDVPQFDLPRYDPPRGVSDRMAALISNKKVENQMLGYLEQGKSIGQAPYFYYNEPLRQAFISELGQQQGQTNFAKYMDYVAATSPRSKVPENARNASYYYVNDLQGAPAPNVGDPIAPGYGHMAQKLHQSNVNQLMTEGGWDVFKNPKPASFSQNLQGNFAPITADAHAVKLPAMLAKDPRFLATSYKAEKGAPMIYPQRMLASGEMSMKQLLDEPTLWESQPRANEYPAFEQYYKRLASKAGFDAPAMAQASGWAAGGPTTGLGSVAGDPFMRAVEARANLTAAKRGITPQEALSQFIRGKAPLLSIGGAAAIGSLAAPNYQPQEY